MARPAVAPRPESCSPRKAHERFEVGQGLPRCAKRSLATRAARQVTSTPTRPIRHRGPQVIAIDTGLWNIGTPFEEARTHLGLEAIGGRTVLPEVHRRLSADQSAVPLSLDLLGPALQLGFPAGHARGPKHRRPDGLSSPGYGQRGFCDGPATIRPLQDFPRPSKTPVPALAPAARHQPDPCHKSLSRFHITTYVLSSQTHPGT